MYRSYADTGGNVNEEIKLLNSISHVSARLARNLRVLAASQSEEGGKEKAFARYIQCSEAVSKYGMLGKHPTTGAAIASPFTQLLMNFQKQANLLWYEIYDIVKQNCTEPFEGSPQDSVMEQLLRSRRNM